MGEEKQGERRWVRKGSSFVFFLHNVRLLLISIIFFLGFCLVSGRERLGESAARSVSSYV